MAAAAGRCRGHRDAGRGERGDGRAGACCEPLAAICRGNCGWVSQFVSPYLWRCCARAAYASWVHDAASQAWIVRARIFGVLQIA